MFHFKEMLIRRFFIIKYYHNSEVKIIEDPCKNCERGFGSISQGKDEKGEYTEIISCNDTCERLSNYIKKSLNINKNNC